MPRLSSRIQQAPFGTRNPAAPGRAPAPSVQHRGPALAVELFANEQLDPATRRALVAIQQNVRQSLGPVRSSPLAQANLVQGVTLQQGLANGVNPNFIAHGLGVTPSGYIICFTAGGFVTAHAHIPPVSNDPKSIIRVWTQWTAFAGVTAVTADILVYA